MTPLDDELRALLQSRAEQVAPAPDPLGGIERRAKRMRRNRVGASVVGGALAVAAIAVAVPALIPDRDGASQVAVTPVPSPTATLSAGRSYGPNELDPEHPWAFRGDRAVLSSGNVTTLLRDWELRHPQSVINPIFGQVYEPSQQAEIVFVSHAVGDERWGVATTGQSGIDLLVDDPLPVPSTALMAVLPGDELPRLLVVAGPATGDLSYAKDGASFQTVPGPTAGIAFIPLEGDTTQDLVRVLDGNGDMNNPVFRGPAPDASPTHTATPSGATPANYLDWVGRANTPYPMDDSKVRFLFAQSMGRPADSASAVYHALFTGKDGQIAYTVGQAWFRGDTEAHTFGWASGTDSGNEVFLGPLTPKGSQLIAYVVSRPSKGTDLLVIVPRIGAGPVSYSPDRTSAFVQKANGRSDQNPVALIDRDPKATNDRVEVRDGDGMHVLYSGAVSPLLCGASGCG
ncbi:MAG: hypothetical protein QOJ79_485 [Actinomycetota bacterium]|jgi:hypothetical protein|nr:hypothetical protein [Actinomycetota bacterium]